MSATCLGMCTRERRRTSRLRSICAHVMLPAPAKGMAGGANTSCIASTWRGASVTDVETCMVPYSPRPRASLHSIGGITRASPNA
jgi:hypothetical protein